jgi:hypothetical protein
VNVGTYPTQIIYQAPGGSPYTIPVNSSGYYPVTSVLNQQTYTITITYARVIGGGGNTVVATIYLGLGAGTTLPLRLDWFG